MTCIAWDGKYLAADKRATSDGFIATVTKIRRLANGDLVGWTGCQDAGELVCAWYEAGADPAKWPECQKDAVLWSRLIVVNADGIWEYERQPIRLLIEDKFMAWGSGREAAMAVMHCGKSAQEAVRIASIYNNTCGNGIDVLKGPK